jgi:hypothetical protein
MGRLKNTHEVRVVGTVRGEDNCNQAQKDGRLSNIEQVVENRKLSNVDLQLLTVFRAESC